MVQAQEIVPIQLDRPYQTECPFITPKNFIQIESGISHEFTKIGTLNGLDITTSQLPTVLWKYGINSKVELRLITENLSYKIGNTRQTGIAPITIGFKTALLEEKGWIPKTAIICHLSTATVGSTFLQTPYTAPSFRFLMQHTLSPKASLSYNIGAEWSGITAEQVYIYTLSYGYAITNKLNAFAELYGFANEFKVNDHRCDAGLTYLLNNNAMVDVSGGLGLSETAPAGFISAGYSYRFNTRNKK